MPRPAIIGRFEDRDVGAGRQRDHLLDVERRLAVRAFGSGPAPPLSGTLSIDTEVPKHFWYSAMSDGEYGSNSISATV